MTNIFRKIEKKLLKLSLEYPKFRCFKKKILKTGNFGQNKNEVRAFETTMALLITLGTLPEQQE